jgi:molybdopterin-synthase adenylyltransferase
MAERLRAFNSGIEVKATAQRIESQAQLAESIAGADVVVDAADWPAHEIEYWCNAACFEAGIPYIAMSHFPPVARAGPLYVPGQTGCFACQDIGFRREYPLYDVAIAQRQAKPSPAATLGPACGLVGGLAGAEVMHFLTGLITPSMLGAGYIFDLRTMEVERFEVVDGQRRYASNVTEDTRVLAILRATERWDRGNERGAGRHSSRQLAIFRIPRPLTTIRLGRHRKDPSP